MRLVLEPITMRRQNKILESRLPPRVTEIARVSLDGEQAAAYSMLFEAYSRAFLLLACTVIRPSPRST